MMADSSSSYVAEQWHSGSIARSAALPCCARQTRQRSDVQRLRQAPGCDVAPPLTVVENHLHIDIQMPKKQRTGR